ncbi:NAD-dependent succinate-semialdehyde dehydrogenase [Curtobacterium sp. MCBA15_001]|uniref:NAD-dependent succinate-semialdehyde dehydrogenase n=1 Tax=Curtobacterium sp. MCBA15_001 TaxID=1898731 RepID=UPI0008DCF301|nr:NAD-dependent succinate-semialdehyde dehydrogenase [Curtobacterium sp. MCBA15_001]OIH92379.1 NADP-dependent succinic semialdehyde dehydrogenase [Curtobacterium sp. MCBA15_001]
MITSVDPRNGAQLATYDNTPATEVDTILDDAVTAQRAWRRTPIGERSALLRRAAAVLRAGVPRYAHTITAEMGKPIVEAEAEIEKCALTLDFYADHAAEFLADTPVASSAADSRVLYEPLGVVLAIMPWNYPFWQFFRFIAPALAAGNGAILKHANNVPAAALAVEEVIREAGAPAGLFRSVLINSSEVAGLIADDRIAAVTLTGSTEVGAIVASQAGTALKKQVLELGGSDPFIVLADADVPAAAKAAVKARYTNNGQSCVNAKRFIVEESIADEFVAEFKANVEALKLGDPFERDTNIGPMARGNLRDELHDQVTRTLDAGGVLVTGGVPVEGPGFYYPATIIDHVTPKHAAFVEETFGPVAAVIRAKDATEAVELANDTEFGLGAAVWSADLSKAEDLARQIDAGAVFVNSVVASDPRLPFGGIKRSGYGRELGVNGIREFVNVKTLSIGTTAAPKPAAATVTEATE